MANRKSNEHRRHHSHSPRMGNNNILRSWFKWGGLMAALIAILVVIVLAQSRSGGISSDSESLEQNIKAADFSLTLYQGADVLGSEELKFSEIFSLGKPVVLNFWAGLCPPCRAEMPSFQNVYDDLGDQFILLGLDIGPFTGLGSNEDGRNLLQELNITYPAGMTADGSIAGAYEIRGMPTTVFLTADRTIYEIHTGILTEGTLREKVESLIQASEVP